MPFQAEILPGDMSQIISKWTKITVSYFFCNSKLLTKSMLKKTFGSTKITCKYRISTCNVVYWQSQILWRDALIKFSCLMFKSDIRDRYLYCSHFIHEYLSKPFSLSSLSPCQLIMHFTFSLHLGNPLLNGICVLYQQFLGGNHLNGQEGKFVF